MAMEKMNNIFSENPSSFRMNKNSTTVAMLKASITDKLNQFFVNYTDDVLAEYIVVLVCNGKNQNQAKDHLEAFLGDRSAEFVSWLWDLLRSFDDSHRFGVVKNKHKLRMLRGLHNHVKGDANTMPNNEHGYIPSTFAPQPISLDKNEVSEGSQHCSQGSDASLNEIEMERQKQSFKLRNSSEVSKYSPSKVKVSSGVPADSEQIMIPVNENKMISICENYLPRERISLPKYERPSSNLRSITKENPKYDLPAGTGVTGNRFSPRPIDSTLHKSDTRRVSVWDRLGRVRDVTRTTEVRNINVMKRRIVEYIGEAHYQNGPMHFSSGARFNGSLKIKISASDICSDSVNTSNDDDDKRLEYELSPVDTNNRKRQFSEIGSAEESKYRHLHYAKPLKQFKRSSSANDTSTESLNSISSGTGQTELPQTCPDVSPSNDDKRLEYDLSPVDKTKRKRQCSEIGYVEKRKYRHLHCTKPLKQSERSSSAKSTSTESLNNISSGTKQIELLQTCSDMSPRELNGEALNSAKTNVEVQSILMQQLLDMKLRLHQIEMQMSKLKSKQLESTEGKPEVLSNSGVLSHSDKDVVARTVFVTNSLSIKHKGMSISNPPRNAISESPSVDVTGQMGSLRTGLKNAAGEWGEYRQYVVGENMELGSPGIYNDNPSLMYHTGYGYNPQMPYGPYYQQLVPSNMPYINSSTQTDLTVPVGFNQQSDGMLFWPRPGYFPQFGSFGRGDSYHSNSGNASFYDSGQGFDRFGSGALWSDSFKPSDGQRRSLTPLSPAVSPQPFNMRGSFSRNVGMASQQQRPSYGLGMGSRSHNRRYPHSGAVNIPSEQIRGPRASKPKNQDTSELDSSVVLNKNGTTIAEANTQSYNRPDFVTEYCDAKFFVIKSYSEDDVHKSIKYGVWASTPSGNRKLDAAYHEATVKQCPVFLLFSVNGSAQFYGVAEMVGPVDYDKNVDYWQQDRWRGQFRVKWHMVKDVPSSQFRHIILENNDYKPVTNTRDTQEVRLDQGTEMLNIIKFYETNISILDDFNYYEERQRVKQEKKATQQATSTAAPVVGGNDSVKQMSKSFAQAVRLDDSSKETCTERSETQVDTAVASESKVEDTNTTLVLTVQSS